MPDLIVTSLRRATLLATLALFAAQPASAVGLESLLNGTTDAALVSTSLSEVQRQRFIDRYNHPPSTTPVALDGVAIFVNTANPLTDISLPPGREISPALRAFLDFARSAQGQAIAIKAGYVALNRSP